MNTDLSKKPEWWFDLDYKYSYCYANLDMFYNKQYYENCLGDAGDITYSVNKILSYMPPELKINSVLDLGCGFGLYLKKIMDKVGEDCFGIDGSSSAIDFAINNVGISSDKLKRHDLRYPLNLNKKFDLVICTEVAEHIEITFASQLVQNIINHSDLVYFTFVEKSHGHIHHCNMKPKKCGRIFLIFLIMKFMPIFQI